MEQHFILQKVTHVADATPLYFLYVKAEGFDPTVQLTGHPQFATMFPSYARATDAAKATVNLTGVEFRVELYPRLDECP